MKTINYNTTKIKDSDGNWSSIPSIHGESAYELAVKKGFEGSEDDFNESIVKKEDLKSKLDVPSNLSIGKYLRVKSINDDGTPVLECVDLGGGSSTE